MIWYIHCILACHKGRVLLSVNHDVKKLNKLEVYSCSCCFYFFFLYFTLQVTMHVKIAWISVTNGVTPLTVDVEID